MTTGALLGILATWFTGWRQLNSSHRALLSSVRARFHPTNQYYQAAYELGAKLAQHNHTVTTGGGPGIMEAANRGAFENHGRSVGMNIHLRTEQDLNPWTTDSMEFHYFFARKVMMTLASKMFVFFPGGFGTMDEFSEILEMVHTGKMPTGTYPSVRQRVLDRARPVVWRSNE